MLHITNTKTTNPGEDVSLSEKLAHHDENRATEIQTFISRYPEVMASSFEEIRPSMVSVAHRFELKSNNPIYQRVRRIAPEHNEFL